MDENNVSLEDYHSALSSLADIECDLAALATHIKRVGNDTFSNEISWYGLKIDDAKKTIQAYVGYLLSDGAKSSMSMAGLLLAATVNGNIVATPASGEGERSQPALSEDRTGHSETAQTTKV